MIEKTFVLIKPDAVTRGLVGRIISRIEGRGFSITGFKILKLSYTQAEELYVMYKTKLFFSALINHVTSGPVIVMVVEGLEVIKGMRKLSGATNPLEAEAGSIRGSYGLTVTKNSIHSSDSPENAKREIGVFFKPDEIFSYSRY